ncbi:MAG TPA: hypothetical protein VFS67_37170 [Polyangiaceae bacterium]|nr:hypothetical protein [Polyangiaceae bacterium]
MLRLLPARELQAIVEGLRIEIDRAKRIDPPAQVARALVCLPEARDPSSLPATAQQLLHRIVEARGVLRVEALPSAVEPLVARGLVFARAAEGGGAELLLPVAYMVQLKTWEGENPRGIRALLTQVTPSVAAAIASHYLGSSATNPLSLSLEAAWLVLTDPAQLQRELDGLASAERRLLLAIEELGGEVDTEELLELEREPLRLRGAAGATPSRRGVGFALERRGFLVPIHPNRHVVPAEVAALVGAERRAARDDRRREIRALVEQQDHSPRRAVFAHDPAPLALAMAALIRERNLDVRSDLGTPRSLITRFASRFGQDPQRVALIAALSRALGLWDASARNASAPPGSWSLTELGQQLFEVWRHGGAWDEARPEGEVLRASGASREASIIGVVRAIVLESLMDLGEGRWIPWEAIVGFLLTDSRAPGLARLLERWAQRCGIDPKDTTLSAVAERVAFESLHVLGCVDVGEPDAPAFGGGAEFVPGEVESVLQPSAEHAEDGSDDLGDTDDGWGSPAPGAAELAARRVPARGGPGRILRITPRGRAVLSGLAPESKRPSAFVDSQVLRLGDEVRVAQVLGLVPFVELGRVEEQLDVLITPSTVSNALATGLEAPLIRQRLESVARLPEPLQRALVQASAVLGRAQYVSSPGFLWVDDPELRELLRTRRQTADLFIEPSPPGGLLVAPGVDLERVTLRCRTLGVEVFAETDARNGAVSVKVGASLQPESENRARSATRRPSGTRRREPGPGSRRTRAAG